MVVPLHSCVWLRTYAGFPNLECGAVPWTAIEARRAQYSVLSFQDLDSCAGCCLCIPKRRAALSLAKLCNWASGSRLVLSSLCYFLLFLIFLLVLVSFPPVSLLVSSPLLFFSLSFCPCDRWTREHVMCHGSHRLSHTFYILVVRKNGERASEKARWKLRPITAGSRVLSLLNLGIVYSCRNNSTAMSLIQLLGSVSSIAVVPKVAVLLRRDASVHGLCQLFFLFLLWLVSRATSWWNRRQASLSARASLQKSVLNCRSMRSVQNVSMAYRSHLLVRCRIFCRSSSAQITAQPVTSIARCCARVFVALVV